MPLDAIFLHEVALLVADLIVEGDAEMMADEEESEAHCAHSHTDSTADNDSEASAASTMRRATSTMRRAVSVMRKTACGRKRVSSEVSQATLTVNDGERRKRKAHKKSTYVVRKEETLKLKEEMEVLQERLAHLEKQKNTARALLAASERDNTVLRDSIRSEQLALATSQCIVSGLLSREHANPLSINYIRLGTDWESRRRTLLSIKDRTIAHACEYIKARSRFLDPLERHVYEESFVNPNGDFCYARYDTYQFANITSVRQVYDALLAYFHSIEISISERLGDITTRDDFDSVEDSITSFRLLITKGDVPIEKHGVLFMDFFDEYELFGGQPCGVVAIDRVEEDALYPYTPQERMRKDASAAIVLRPHWRPNHGTGRGKELVVSLAIARYIKFHHCEYPVATQEAIEQMRENVMSWGSVMVTMMRNSLHQDQQ